MDKPPTHPPTHQCSTQHTHKEFSHCALKWRPQRTAGEYHRGTQQQHCSGVHRAAHVVLGQLARQQTSRHRHREPISTHRPTSVPSPREEAGGGGVFGHPPPPTPRPVGRTRSTSPESVPHKECRRSHRFGWLLWLHRDRNFMSAWRLATCEKDDGAESGIAARNPEKRNKLLRLLHSRPNSLRHYMTIASCTNPREL